MTTEDAKTKFAKLKELLRSFESVLVSFSGGMDSTFLLKAALDELGPKNAVGYLVRSSLNPDWVTNEARCVGESLGAKIIEIDKDILLMPEVEDNAPERCYHCKREVLATAISNAKSLGLKYVADGTVMDDIKEKRPGRRAVLELGVRSPLLEVGLTKAEIRGLSRDLELSTWNNPSNACLATRFPVGMKITLQKLEQVTRCEDNLRDEGFRVFRLRYHGNLARIELSRDEFPRMFEDGRQDRVVDVCKAAGFKYVAMDLDGYRSGSMSEQ